MKKLKFNEGGQPVWLDDLELLQGNMLSTNIGQAFLTDGQKGYAIGRVLESQVGLNFLLNYKVKAHRIVVGDNVYDIEAMNNAVTDLDTLYYHLKEEDVDERLFADGEQKACGTSMTGWIDTTATATGAVSYKWNEIENLPFAVKKAIGLPEWTDLDVTPLNGFDVYVRTKIMDTDVVRTRISVRGSLSSSWSSTEKRLFGWNLETGKRTQLINTVTESHGVHRRTVNGPLLDCGRLAFDEAGCYLIMDSNSIVNDTPAYYDISFIINK